MDDVQAVAVANSGHSLPENAPTHVFVYAVGVFQDVVVEVSAVSQLLDEVQLVLGVYDLVEADDARMGHQLHAADLLVEVGLRDFVQFQFVDDFDGDPEPREDVAGALHHGEVALAQGLLHVVESRDLGHLEGRFSLASLFREEKSCGVKQTAVQILEEESSL